MQNFKNILFAFSAISLFSCSMGPDYEKPEIETPESFKASFKDSEFNWQISSPDDDEDRGEWWKVFEDPLLNKLEEELNANNYSIQAAISAYNQAAAQIDKAKIGYLPSISAGTTVTREKQNTSLVSSTNKTASKSSISTNRALTLSASWEPDLWGSVAKQVESSEASAGVALANLASLKLSSQASLAQYYYQYIMLMRDQKFLDEIISANEATLKYAESRFKAGIGDAEDVALATQNLQNSKSDAVDNLSNITQYQNAIATITGKSPSTFYLILPPEPTFPTPTIPQAIPSDVVQRRPDIAASERNVAIANAGIGIAKSAFFPSFSITGSTSFQGSGFNNLLSFPTRVWSLGPELALNLTNFAAYDALTDSALESYNASIANYRQTVISAFGEVENNMSALNAIDEQIVMEKIIFANSKKIYDITLNKYKSGTIDLAQVSNALITYSNSQKALNDLNGKRVLTLITLIKSLGGGWENSLQTE